MQAITRDPTPRSEDRDTLTAAPQRERSLPELGQELAGLLEQAEAASEGGPLPLRDWVDLAEAWYITSALRRCGGNRSAAARSLGIGRRTLYAKMEKLGIQPTWSSNGLSGTRRSGGDAQRDGLSPEPQEPDPTLRSAAGGGGSNARPPVAASGN